MKSEIEEIYVVYWLYRYIAFRFFLYLCIFFYYTFYFKKERKFLKNITLRFMYNKLANNYMILQEDQVQLYLLYK